MKIAATKKCKLTDRVKHLKLYADNAAEELMLTQLYESLCFGELESLVLTHKDGTTHTMDKSEPTE